MKSITSHRLFNRILIGYLCFAAVIFAGTALAKLLSDFSNPDLRGADPFIRFISAKHLMILVAILEIGVSAFILKSIFHAPKSGIFAVLWLSGLFVIYRIGFAFSPEQGVACKCFGVGTLIGKSEAGEDLASMILLILLLVPGAILLWLTRENQNAKSKITLMIAVFFFAESSKTSAQDLTFEPLFTAQGVLNDEYHWPDEPIEESDPTHFEISADAKGRWQINVKSFISDISDTIWLHDSFDGTNVFSTFHATTVRLADGTRKTRKNVFTGNLHFADIKRGPLPNDANGIGQLWFIFFGGEHLAKHPEFKFPSFFSIPSYTTDPLSWAFDSDFEWHENAKSPLLKRGKFTLNPDLLFDDLIHYPEVLEPTEEGLQEINFYMDEYKTFAKHAKKTNPELLTMGTFEIEEIVSGANFSFPKKASWEIHGINPTNVTMRYFSGRGGLEITNYTIHPRGTRLPLLPKLTGTNVSYTDFRFQFRDDEKYFNEISYELSDGIWPISTNDSRIAWKEGEFQFEPRTRLAGRRFMYFLNVTLAVILFSLPAVIWWQKRKQARK